MFRRLGIALSPLLWLGGDKLRETENQKGGADEAGQEYPRHSNEPFSFVLFLLLVDIALIFWTACEFFSGVDWRATGLALNALAVGLIGLYVGHRFVERWPEGKRRIALAFWGCFMLWMAFSVVAIRSALESERLARISDWLEPGTDATPEIPAANLPHPHIASNEIAIEKGEIALVCGSVLISTPDTHLDILNLYGSTVLAIDRIGDRITVSAEIRSEDEKIVAEIKTNKFVINPNNYFPPPDRPDRHTLRVRDPKGNTVLSVRYLNKQAIKLNGVFRSAGKDAVTIAEESIIYGPCELGKGYVLHTSGSPLIQWPVGPLADGAARSIITIGTNRYALLQIGGTNIHRVIGSGFFFRLHGR